jgi:hypothetical protein
MPTVLTVGISWGVGPLHVCACSYRFCHLPPSLLPFPGGLAGGQLVLTIPQDSVLTLLSGHQHATIDHADGAESSKSTAVFSVAGLEKFRAPFLAACARRGGESK